MDAMGRWIGVVTSKTGTFISPDERADITSLALAVDGRVAVAWIQSQGVPVLIERGPPPRGSDIVDADARVRSAVARIWVPVGPGSN